MQSKAIRVLCALVAVGCGSSEHAGKDAAGGMGALDAGGAAGERDGGATGGHGGGGADGGGQAAGGTGTDGGADRADSGATNGTDGGGGAGGQRDGGGGASGDGGLPACVSMDDPRATFVDYQRTNEIAPAPMGGPIAGGTYFLTGLTYYGGTQLPTPCTLSQVREVLRFAATSDTEGTMHSTLIFQYSDGSGRSTHPIETTYKAQGTSLMGRYTCWEPYAYTENYTAAANQIRFIRGPFDGSCDKGVTLVLTYDKQP